MGLPLFAVAVLVKKIVGVGLYQSAKRYGFPRTYRRLIEGIKATNLPKEQELLVRYAIKQSMRFPSRAHEFLSQSEVASFLISNGENILNQRNMPQFFKTLSSIVSQPILFGSSALDLLRKSLKIK
mmetsp:Transcript_8619/g.14614  ORF Transcript_8619/g.14614 Transcript_8619/m.14614 type:complete len:126 (+) Transcript_8619:186-563(+)